MSPQNRSSLWDANRPYPDEFDEFLDIGDLRILERIEARIGIPILLRDPINPIRINTRDTTRVIFQFKRVIELDLSHLTLTDIPQEIFSLKTLRKLNLSNNRLTEIPDFIQHFPMLRVLNLRGNKIKKLPEIGYTPEFKGKAYKERQYSALIWLDIGMNLIGEIPGSIRRVPNLQVLIADQNRISKISETIGTLTRLQKLELDSNRISAAPSLKTLTELTTLKIQNNSLKTLELPPSLKMLMISSNKFKQMPDLSHMLGLETLSIQSNPIRRFHANFGSSFGNMKTFLIDSTQVRFIPGSFEAYHTLKIVQIPNSSPISIFAYVSTLVLIAIVLLSIK
jgi:Leucine-rich repeat (LRR) protein